MKNTYTAYLVRDTANRRYLNAPTYTGRRPEAWGRIGDAHLFHSEAQAQNCVSNINRRGYRTAAKSSPTAAVVPIEMFRNG